MKVDASMESYAARLASFTSVLTSKKKRSSEVKGAKKLKWPHQVPSPPQLAKAGFYYKATPTSPDNVSCYLCHCNLDGWEDDDDPITEHLKHSPSCGWANIAFIEQLVESGERGLEDPSSEKLTAARAMTFGSTWPHDSKRGWVCKTQKMVEAGWHYCPTLESDDFVKCAYCSLSLDGWEPKDNPYDEHQRRSPDCMFFSFSSSSQPNATGKTKKSRTSEMSRTSTQSVSSLVSEDPSIMSVDLQDHSIISIAESVKNTKGGKGSKKGKKSKVQESKEEATQLASSFIEPEDDDFEVKVVKPTATKTRGKKRKSEEVDGTAETANRSMPKKRRSTRTRNSVASVQAAPEIFNETDQLESNQDVEMADGDETSQLLKPRAKKGPKQGKKRGSSTTRKASSKSIASEASLRAGIPNDEEIDAALEAELDRPLTDDGEDDEQESSEPTKARRLTRSKPIPKATDASTAPTRRNTRTSTFATEDSVDEPYSAITTAHNSEKQMVEDAEMPLPKPLPIAKATKKTGTRKASATHKSKDPSVKDVEQLPSQADMAPEIIKPKQLRGTKISRGVTGLHSSVPDTSAPQPGVDTVSITDGSTVASNLVEDESSHEADANAREGSTRRSKASTAKKTKDVKKNVSKSRIINDAVKSSLSDQLVTDIQDVADAALNDFKDPEAATRETKKPTKTQKNKLKTERKKNVKNAVPNTSKAEGFVSGARSSKQARVSDEPFSSPAGLEHSTLRPAPSPQSSDAENQPPSSRPSKYRPPLSSESHVESQEARVPLAVITTPFASPSKGNFAKLQSTLPWTAMDIDQIFHGTPDVEKENQTFANNAKLLTSSEKKLTVEEWIKSNAQRGEEKLRNDCERLVSRFEDQGVRALRAIEGIICVD